jgi:ATP-binding cassette subfamily B protein RaxB
LDLILNIYRQSQIGECGLVCLAIIASAYNIKLSLSNLRLRFPQAIRGVNLKQLINLSSDLGFTSRPLRLDLSELKELSMPCVLHWDFNHFVVLSEIKNNKVLVIDPACGKRFLSFDEVSLHFTGIALELTPVIDFKIKLNSPKIKLAQITGAVNGFYNSAFKIIVVALFLELIGIALPLFNQVVIDEVLASGDRDLLLVILIGFTVVVLIQAMLNSIRSWLILELSQSISQQWLMNVFSHLLRLPVSWFEQRNLGFITSNFNSVREIQRNITNSMIESFLDGVMAVASFIAMWIYSPTLTGIVLFSTAMYGAIRYMSFSLFRNVKDERLSLFSQERTFFTETIRAFSGVKLFGRESERNSKWNNLIVEISNCEKNIAKMDIVFVVSKNLVFGLENLFVFWFGAQMILVAQNFESNSNFFTIGMLLAFISFKMQFTSRISSLINHGIDFKMLDLHIEYVADIVLTPPEEDKSHHNSRLINYSNLSPSLELRNVSFRYNDGEPWILKNINIKILTGESVAIVGASGCGKTTLLKIALGLLTPLEGEVLYGGVPVKQIGMANFRSKVGTVMQDDVLLSGSIAENTTFFDMWPDQKRIEHCNKLAQLHNDIVNMPMGYETLLGELGTGLSGGQKQRLLLARALYKQPSILALDEATSHLDVINELAVGETLSHMKITRILIAHRKETIENCQRQFMFDANGLVEITLKN